MEREKFHGRVKGAARACSHPGCAAAGEFRAPGGTLLGTTVRDIDCAFKVFHRSVLEAIPIRSVGAFVNTEILVRARAAGFRIHQVPVSHRRRLAGRQSGADLRVIARALVELVKLRAALSPSRPRPRAQPELGLWR